MTVSSAWPRPPPVWTAAEQVKLPPTVAYADVHRERQRAHAKHGAAGNSREDAHWLDREWLPILMEELGEAAHEITYDALPENLPARLRAELVQVAAMACAWIDAIDRSGE